MNLIGKILIIVIFVLSIIFMGFAMAVYSTHRNWFEAVNGKAGQGGLLQQLSESQAEIARLKADHQKELDSRSVEIADFRNALATAEQARTDLQRERDRIEIEYDTKVKELEDARSTLAVTQDNLSARDQEVVQLRDRIRDTIRERDDKDRELALAMDNLHQKSNESERLAATNTDLLARLTRFELVLKENDINPFVSDAPPAKLRGQIVASNADGLVELNLGSDDGLRVNHTLEVIRDNNYLGRIELTKVNADTSVGKILTDYQIGPIQRGDNVRSRPQ